MKKVLSILLVLVLALGFVACSDGQKQVDLVKVGDTVINSSELDQYVELYALLQQIDLSQFDEGIVGTFKESVLEELINFEAMKQHFAGQEDKIFPETAGADLKKFLDQSKQDEETVKFIKDKGITDDVLTNFFYSQFYARAYYDEVKAGMPTIEKDAQAYYEENKELYAVDEVTASHILVEEESLAEEILEKIKSGAKFEDMAAQYGTDGTKDTGGSLGTFGRGQMVKEFEDAAFALEPGELSDVVQTKFGFHIIKVTDKNQGIRTYEEVQSSIEGVLVGEESQIKLEELRDNLGVEYLTDEYTGQPKNQD